MPPDPRLAAALAPRFEILRELGRGGMATVYLAHDRHNDRDVALKVLRPELAAALGSERFLHEIRITAQLDHPHILTLLDSGRDHGIVWYATPWIRGESLREKIEREKRLDVPEALSIARQVAGALAFAHRHGVIHRDLKPENILLHEGEAMLADFGIALAVEEAGGGRLTESGLLIGTPKYMSPEQAAGARNLDARSDLYALAVVLYEMLTGAPPHTGPTPQKIMADLLTAGPRPVRELRPDVPAAVGHALEKALAKNPEDRFAGPAEFAEALARAEPAPAASR
ncbi:MAG TPA: serine/threonine-protein kinase, partial [Gemmatimonadales bacterium]|nr:serine/threonine-protein kinase [Gemmatimonadales bacterium]